MNRCEICDIPISEERLKATNGEAKTCLDCADKVVDKFVGFVVYPHKTAGDVELMKNPTAEQIRQAKRAYDRSR